MNVLVTHVAMLPITLIGPAESAAAIPTPIGILSFRIGGRVTSSGSALASAVVSQPGKVWQSLRGPMLRRFPFSLLLPI